jgi:hypothetical protein
MKRLTTWEIFHSVDMAIACAISYTITTELLVRFVDEPTKLLGALFAVIATVFVFRESRASSLSAGLARLIATCVSFAVCLPYLLIFPVTGLGMAVAIGLGAIVMILLSREDHIFTTGITIAVVLVVARLSSLAAWQRECSRGRRTEPSWPGRPPPDRWSPSSASYQPLLGSAPTVQNGCAMATPRPTPFIQ